MDLDHIGQYILPILIVLFYLFAGGKKKKPQEPPQQEAYPDDFDDEEDLEDEEEEAYTPPPLVQRLPRPPQKAASSLPPVQRTLSDFESAISSRHVANNIEDRSYVSAISDERAQSLISSGLSERIDLDQAYAIKPRHRPSRGRSLLAKSSLKDAFILQEIFKRPDAF
ncbi:MAG: hypothetical protein JSR39_07060 [Verrucomicrobia bacterium]|nr:hypothetical protein [Verrucomicrobiota bacterium]